MAAAASVPADPESLQKFHHNGTESDGFLLLLHWIITPEQELKDIYHYNGNTYGVRQAMKRLIYLRHVWGDMVPAFYADPKENHTAYAYTWVYSPKDQEVGLWVEFQNYSRSEMDLAPLPGKWVLSEL